MAISDIAKIATAGVIAVGGYKYGWQNRKFERIHTCVGSFCLEIKKNPTPAANVANPAIKQLKVTANSAAGPSAGPQSKHYAQRLL